MSGIQEVKKMKISLANCDCTCIHLCVFTCMSGVVSMCLYVHISQCIQLPLLMENVPGEKSPRFRVQVQISL